jgi:hypothetical protein
MTTRRRGRPKGPRRQPGYDDIFLDVADPRYATGREARSLPRLRSLSDTYTPRDPLDWLRAMDFLQELDALDQRMPAGR